MKRRSFLQGIGGAIGAVVAGRAVASEAKPSKRVVGIDRATGPDTTAVIELTKKLKDGYDSDWAINRVVRDSSGGYVVPTHVGREIEQRLWTNDGPFMAMRRARKRC